MSGDARGTALRRFLIVGLAVPVVLALVAIALMVAWLPELPSPAAIHWGFAGPDGFGPAWSFPVLTAVVGLGFPLLFFAIVWFSARAGEWGPTFRLLGAMSLGLSVFFTIVLTWSVAMQRGLTDAADAPDVLGPLAVGLVLGVAAGLLGWFLQPRVEAGGDRAGRPAQPVAPGTRLRWTGTARMPQSGTGVLVVAFLGLLAGLAAAAFAGVWPVVWVLTGVAVLDLVLAAGLSAFRVRVDDAGLTVQSVLGLPRFHIPLANITAVETATVHALAQFGGWGIRYGLDGRFGVVLRSGEALQVRRARGGTFVVTVDDAGAAASVLQALVDRSRTT